jgi:hypothetical protein
MAGHIEHEPAPGKSGAVFNPNGRDFEAVLPGADQLRKGLQSPERSRDSAGFQARAATRHIQLVRFILAQRGKFVAALMAFNHQSLWGQPFWAAAALPGGESAARGGRGVFNTARFHSDLWDACLSRNAAGQALDRGL